MSEFEGLLFCLHPWSVANKKNRKKICDPELGPHLFFRHIKDAVQSRLAEHIDFASSPRVFLYGNPHIDNYARTNTGCGMIDFDSAMYGPYVADILSILLSINLRHKSYSQAVDSSSANAFFTSYQASLANPEQAYESYAPLVQQTPKDWQLSPEAYIQSGKKWAKKLSKYPLPTHDPIIKALVRQYFVNRNEPIDKDRYKIVQAGQGVGSMGRLHNLIVLQDKKAEELKLLDIKHTKNYINLSWPHHRYFNHDFQHEGIRMIAASQLHAPNVTHNESHALINGIQYWGCELPTINIKINGLLEDGHAVQFARAVGSQMGKSHALSLRDNCEAQQLIDHCTENFSNLISACKNIKSELLQAWEHYCYVYTNAH